MCCCLISKKVRRRIDKMQKHLNKHRPDEFEFTLDLMSLDNDREYQRNLIEFQRSVEKKHPGVPYDISITLDQDTLPKPWAIVRARAELKRP